MISADELIKRGDTIYAVVVAAAKRARIINDWRIQRSKVLLEETTGPKVIRQALEEIASGEVRVVQPEQDEERS